jgi:hypothetical protein
LQDDASVPESYRGPETLNQLSWAGHALS